MIALLWVPWARGRRTFQAAIQMPFPKGFLFLNSFQTDLDPFELDFYFYFVSSSSSMPDFCHVLFCWWTDWQNRRAFTKIVSNILLDWKNRKVSQSFSVICILGCLLGWSLISRALVENPFVYFPDHFLDCSCALFIKNSFMWIHVKVRWHIHANKYDCNILGSLTFHHDIAPGIAFSFDYTKKKWYTYTCT